MILFLILIFALCSSAQAVLPNIFATQPTGNVPASYLDANFTFLESQGVQGITTTGSSNAYIATPADAWTPGYSSFIARALTIMPNFTNTSSATINVSSLGNASIYKNVGGVSTSLSAGDMTSGIPAVIVCDGTNFLLTNPTSNFQISPTFRNPLINGDIAIAQRGTSFTGINGFSTPVQTLDGWFGWTDSTASMTISQQAGNISGTGFNNVIRVQRPNGNTSTAVHRVGQIILTADSTKFAGQTATLSFYARSGANFSAASANLIEEVQQGTGTNQGSTSFTNTTWTGQTVASFLSQPITSTMTRYSVLITFASNASEIAVTFGFTPIGTAGSADYFDITGVQLELGGVETGYEYLPFETQLQRALPFYEKSFEYATAPATQVGIHTGETISMAGKVGATAQFAYINFKVPKWKDPVLTTYNVFNNDGNIYDETASGECSSTAASWAKQTGGVFTATGNGSTAVGNILGIHWTAEAAL